MKLKDTVPSTGEQLVNGKEEGAEGGEKPGENFLMIITEKSSRRPARGNTQGRRRGKEGGKGDASDKGGAHKVRGKDA